MADAVFVIDPGGYYREFKSWSGDVGQYMLRITTKEMLLAKHSAPSPGSIPRGRTRINYSTGRLKAGIIPNQARWGTELEGQVISTAPYSLMVHGGTSRHFIRARNPGGRMRFYWALKAKWVYPEIVYHPGAPAIPFLSENLRDAIR